MKNEAEVNEPEAPERPIAERHEWTDDGDLYRADRAGVERWWPEEGVWAPAEVGGDEILRLRAERDEAAERAQIAEDNLAPLAKENYRYKALAGKQRGVILQLSEWALGCDDPSRFLRCDNFHEIRPKAVYRMVPSIGLIIRWEELNPIMDVLADPDGQRAAEEWAALKAVKDVVDVVLPSNEPPDALAWRWFLEALAAAIEARS